jgi:hypothetical protein
MLAGHSEWSGTTTFEEKCQLIATPIASSATAAAAVAASARQCRRGQALASTSPTAPAYAV